ncbi:splicing factor, suppressor of white-apricot homolog isoform X2 [Abrus precatorius]|uniref:Splicing factor, suppressor of white-apricot homolog isoform X2 n=1 Tax=Abrus precatorius TaxID=3816 RepID=A0A8B8JI92_ABRPR|nr:splicing factor, suppressor of white-apricot homolog isoform X2 [Abrus precatorius]XP_027331120.1 splicing factor, suppressor of white-apricot homolog isoform X2 [Abrus precatorius]XP_027331124.1 splicing factor, suppressor of white-apricot homolog isoform X2 [Abrus precatorius]
MKKHFLFVFLFQPPNEKVHQIISRTAMFVSKHGSQSEIILRVKQGDNPTFGFLMPDHHLHAYFRFLVDHQEVLKVDKDDSDSTTDKNRTQGLDKTGGALSLLGSAYGSAEDEDGTTENTHDFERKEYEGFFDTVSARASPGIEQAESCSDAAKKDRSIPKNSIPSLKEKVPVIKRNHSISAVKTATAARAKTDSVSNAENKSQTSVPSIAKIELPVVEPPSDLKRAIEKIVEFIVKNGKQFEAVLAEQDRAHGRFPFLLPSNRYHTYYLKALQTAEKSKLLGKGYQKHNPVGRAVDNNTAVHEESDNLSYGSMASDLPHDMDRKEKFKMIIGKSKKDGQDPTTKDSQAQNTVSMDAAAAAAILQAATRGIKRPNVELFTKTSSGSGQGLGSDGGYLSSSGSLYSSQPQGLVENSNLTAKASASAPVAKAIAEKVAIAAAGEADSSEAHMTKEQKLKAERLKRAKMFAAMLKSGVGTFKSELPRALSVEPPGSGLSGSDAEARNLVVKEREGSSVPFEVDNSDKSQKSEEKLTVDNNERRSKRSYRSRSGRYEEEEEEEENKEDKRDRKRSRKKHCSHRSSHSSRDRHKHKRRHSSKDKYSHRGTKHDSSSDDEHQHSRQHHKYDSSSDEKHHSSKRRHRENSISEHEHRHSRHSYKQSSSSDAEHRYRSRSVKHKSKSHAERETDLEEGEIIMKSDKSIVTEVGRASREASAGLSKSDHHERAPSQSPEITDVSDELRAKIRAMLMANL